MPAEKISKIKADQVRQVYLHHSVGLIATAANAILLTAVLWGPVAHRTLLAWLGVSLLLALGRLIVYRHYRYLPDNPETTRLWKKRFLVGIFLSGAVWGMAGILLFPPGSLAHQIFIAFVIGGMIAGAVAAFSALKEAFLLFSLPALTPITVRFLVIADPNHVIMGLMLLLFQILMVVTARRVHRTMMTSLKLGHENRELVDYLTRANQEGRSLNRQLQKEITIRARAEERLRKHQDELETLVKKRTAELSASEEKYRKLVTTAREGIFIVQDKVIIFANPAGLEMLKYPAEELYQLPFEEFISPADREAAGERYAKRMGGEELPEHFQLTIIDKEGKERELELSTGLITWDERPAALVLARDITEKIKIEEKIRKARELESIGSLAAGVAHEFNNLLMGAQGNLSLLEEMADDEATRQALENFRGCIREGKELTGKLLGFARRGKYEVTTENLNDIIDKTSRIFREEHPGIWIHDELQADPAEVEADRGQLERVFMDLYINAAEAMPGGGDLYLKTGTVDIDKDFSRRHGIEPGRYIKVTVTDTGRGMNESGRERIFEPFSSATERERAPGLSLPFAYGVINNHDGLITVTSRKKKGTTFTIFLPLSDNEGEKKKRGSPELRPGERTALVIEDQKAVLTVIERFLRKIGFEVHTASNGEDGLDIYRERKDDIDIVILDMIMPGMSGRETYRRLRKINPEIRVILASGYSRDRQAREILTEGCNGFIQKPFDLQELADKISAVL